MGFPGELHKVRKSRSLYFMCSTVPKKGNSSHFMVWATGLGISPVLFWSYRGSVLIYQSVVLFTDSVKTACWNLGRQLDAMLVDSPG